MSKKNLDVPCTLAPCDQCPFTKTCPAGWLARRIELDVLSDTFVCHKTYNRPEGRLQCAGHMLLTEEDNTMVALAKYWGMMPELKGRERVFDSIQDCIYHHKNVKRV